MLTLPLIPVWNKFVHFPAVSSYSAVHLYMSAKSSTLPTLSYVRPIYSWEKSPVHALGLKAKESGDESHNKALTHSIYATCPTLSLPFLTYPEFVIQNVS